MPDKLIQEGMEKTQGQAQVDEANAAAAPMAEAAPLPTEQPTEAAPEAQPTQAAPVAPPPFQPQSYMETIPANILFAQGANQPKTDFQQRADMSIFWKMLASRQQAPGILRAISKELAGE